MGVNYTFLTRITVISADNVLANTQSAPADVILVLMWALFGGNACVKVDYPSIYKHQLTTFAPSKRKSVCKKRNLKRNLGLQEEILPLQMQILV